MATEKKAWRGRIRLMVRVLVATASVVALLAILPWSWAPMILPAMSPYVTVTSAIAARTVGWATLVGLPVLVVVVMRRRWFCRWICPVGLCAEHLGRVSPLSSSRSRYVPPVGKWIVAASVAGALVGYPLLIFLDPLAMLSGVFNVRYEPFVAAGKVSAIALGVVALVTIVLPGSWCLRLCPLGASQELLAAPVRWWSRRCPEDTSGVAAQSVGAISDGDLRRQRRLLRTAGDHHRQRRLLRSRSGVKPPDSKPAAQQEPRPPEASTASSVEPSVASPVEPAQISATQPARRDVLAMGIGVVFGGTGAALGLDARRNTDESASGKLRPPGAVDEWQFHQLCLRCGNCVRACPVGILHPDWNSKTLSGWLTPVVEMGQTYCREDCAACMRVCPSGAIPWGSVDGKMSALIGKLHVDKTRCILALGGECPAPCVESCPFEAIHIKKWSWDDDQCYPIVDSERCPGCGACLQACQPMDALSIRPGDMSDG